jgi:hypothetical protein
MLRDDKSAEARKPIEIDQKNGTVEVTRQIQKNYNYEKLFYENMNVVKTAFHSIRHQPLDHDKEWKRIDDAFKKIGDIFFEDKQNARRVFKKLLPESRDAFILLLEVIKHYPAFTSKCTFLIVPLEGGIISFLKQANKIMKSEAFQKTAPELLKNLLKQMKLNPKIFALKPVENKSESSSKSSEQQSPLSSEPLAQNKTEQPSFDNLEDKPKPLNIVPESSYLSKMSSLFSVSENPKPFLPPVKQESKQESSHVHELSARRTSHYRSKHASPCGDFFSPLVSKGMIAGSVAGVILVGGLAGVMMGALGLGIVLKAIEIVTEDCRQSPRLKR